MAFNGEIFGLPIPDAGPIFATALVIHILCGLTAVIAGALAATARKQPGRHPLAGRVYLWGPSAESLPPRRSWPRSVGTKTPTYSPSPSLRSASACTDTALADATDQAGHLTTTSAWAAPTSPYSPASTSTMEPSSPMGPAAPPHLLAPAQPHRRTSYLADTVPLR
jgi:hypothetical protein